MFTSISCWFGTFSLPCNPMMVLVKSSSDMASKKKTGLLFPSHPWIRDNHTIPKEQQPMASQDLRLEQPFYLRVGISVYLQSPPRCHRVSSNKCLPWFQPSTPLWILRGLQMQSIQRHATHSWSRSWQRPESQLLRLRKINAKVPWKLWSLAFEISYLMRISLG